MDATQLQQNKDPVDLNATADDVDNMKYYEDDDEYIIRNGIKKYIQKAKKREWKKADAALGENALVDLNVNDNWNEVQSKHTSAQLII